MSSSYLQGIQAAFDNQAENVNDIYVVTSNWFVNRCPIVTRTPRVPVGSTTFSIVSRHFRPRNATLGASVAAADVQITLVDGSRHTIPSRVRRRTQLLRNTRDLSLVLLDKLLKLRNLLRKSEGISG